MEIPLNMCNDVWDVPCKEQVIHELNVIEVVHLLVWSSQTDTIDFDSYYYK